MKNIIYALILIAGIIHAAGAYEYEDFISDSKSNPENIYENLHPDALVILNKAFERIRTDKEYRGDIFWRGDEDFSGKSNKEIWMSFWNEVVENNYYEKMVLTDTIYAENKLFKLYVVEDKLFNNYGRVFNTIIFKKSGESYLPMIPETMVVAMAIGRK
jgi:hypothetical protein